MAFHRVLYSYDILPVLFDQLMPRNCTQAIPFGLPGAEDLHALDKAANRNALACSARVCKAWSDFAQNALWEELDSAEPLLNLFSTFVPAAVSAPEEGPEHASLGQMRDQDWARFCARARRLRRLTLGDIDRDLLNATRILASLVPHNGGHPLFPRLVEAEFGIVSAEELIALVSIVPPTLQRLHVNLMDDFDTGPHWQTLCELGGPSGLLQSKLPLVQNVRLMLPDPHFLSPFAPPAPLNKLRRLEILTGLPSFTFETWELLAKMQNLEELHVDVAEGAAELRDVRGFPALRQLTVSTQSWATLDCALQTITSPHLARVQMSRYIFSAFRDEPFELRTTLETLAARFGRSLLAVEVNTPFCAADAPEGAVHLLDMCLRPLLGLRGLECVAFRRTTRSESPRDDELHVELSDNDLGAMAAAWPRLASLTLCLGKSTFVSTAALAHLAAQCPDLTTMEVTKVAVGPASDVLAVPALGLRWLVLVDFEGAPADFAVFLDAVFPGALLLRRDGEEESFQEELEACVRLRELYRLLAKRRVARTQEAGMT
ncbi:hypothetical protein CERSUDRAFT_96564 [Gelatoporia subvermispora B]|uniref:F-box domain-containing protein n=1 Tax=Ceriporiopsis subvermispora (strain B) TaxID=914234 RepID=M2QEH9_CERS8|nr:hypothetical protein CERSUDRAFT_96564 [Gelatoporia subvermispora B]